MKRGVRGLAFVAVTLAHIALVALLTTSAQRHTRELADAPHMALVFIEPEEPRIRNEPSPPSAPSLRLRTPDIEPQQVDLSSPITVAPEASPEATPTPPPIDWQQEAQTAAARAAEGLETEHRRKGKLAPDPRFARRSPRPQFGWDQSKIHRIEALPDGGTIIHLNDRCVLVLNGFLLPICSLGKTPARGDLFEHIGDSLAIDDEP